MPNPFGQTHYVVSQPYGPRDYQDSVEPPFRGYPHYHMGIDLVASPWNAPVCSIGNGTVFAAGQDTDGANYVIVFDGADKYFAYWHLSAIAVKRGQSVTIGTQLGNQGYTGNVEPKGPGGAHLHLEIQQKNPYGATLHEPNNCIDPTPYLDAQGGANNDMDTHQIAKDLYRILTGSVPPDDIINQKADFMTMAGNAQQVIKDLLAAGIDQNETANVWALTNYDEARGGDNPSQFAQDRWFGGDNFPAVIKRDMPNYIKAAQDGDAATNHVATLEEQLKRADDLNGELQGKLDDAQNAPQQAQEAPAGIDEVECQRRVDEAVVITQDKTEAALTAKFAANPWPLVIAWFRSVVKGGGN